MCNEQEGVVTGRDTTGRARPKATYLARFVSFMICLCLLFASTGTAQAETYHQISNPLLGSLSWSALASAMPLAVLFILLGGFRWPARNAALAALVVALAVAIGIYGMPWPQAASGAVEGAAIGFFPIIWIGINSIWVYDLTEASGHSHVLRRSFSSLSDDPRILAILIAFCFGSLLEGLSGGGAPVAICSVMLIALGVDPMRAAAACLIADTSPVAFGALGLPITVLSKLTNLPLHQLSIMIGWQTMVLAMMVPFILLVIVDGRRGLREVWPVALVAGVSFAVLQVIGAMLLPVELVDIVAALLATGATLALLRVWHPQASVQEPVMELQSVGAAATPRALAQAAPIPATADTTTEKVKAFVPYAIILLVVAVAQVPVVGALLAKMTSVFNWPGLSVIDAAGHPVTAVVAKFEWVLSAGSLVLIAGMLCTPVLGISPAKAFRTYLRTLYKLRWAVATVCAVVGLAFVMNLSGQTITLGVWAAGAGRAFAAISPVIGWFGTALTGSDTSTNALFGVLQVTTARATGLSDVLLAAANSAGGVCGKAVSPQNLAIGAVAVAMGGREGELFRRVVGWTLLMIGIMALIVFLQSTPVLSWMVP